MIRVLGLLTLCVVIHPAVAASLAAPQLSVGSPFALPGGTLSFTIAGTPGAAVSIKASRVPAEIHLGAAGIQFYQSGTEKTLASGTIPASGTLTTSLPVATDASPGAIYYAQTVAQLGGQTLLGNAVAYRVQRALPVGARRTQSMAVTPDGTRAYVADNLDGVVSIVDAVHDQKLADLPITVAAGDLPYRPVRVAVAPDGQHAFITNAAASTIAVIHTASGSVSAQIPVPRGSRGVGFDFQHGAHRIYVANETQQAVLVFDEAPAGTYTQKGSIALQTSAPGPVLVMPNGILAVGTRTENVIEVVAPDPSGSTGKTIAVTTVPGTPFELVWDGSEVLIPTFAVVGGGTGPGFNQVLKMDPATYKILGSSFDNLGTDYRSIAVRPTTAGTSPLTAIGASGTGTVIVADGATQAVLANIELTGGYPDATPQDVAIVNDASSQPAKIYVLDLFRETVRPIVLSGGPPYAVGPEIPLAWSGQVRVPLTGTLSKVDNGEWRFRNVVTLGGSAFKPNPVTCNTCHMDGASDNSRAHLVQVPAPWGALQTAPYFWDGSVPTIQRLILGAFGNHDHTGVRPDPGSLQGLLDYLTAHQPPASIYLNQNGSMTADQQAGKVLFEGAAKCSQCHAAPTFIPPPGSPPTIEGGIGTGQVPANVPSLRGAWATAPYLHRGEARTLMDVLTINPSDAHGQAAAPLTQTELQQLVEYLKTL